MTEKEKLELFEVIYASPDNEDIIVFIVAKSWLRAMHLGYEWMVSEGWIAESQIVEGAVIHGALAKELEG